MVQMFNQLFLNVSECLQLNTRIYEALLRVKESVNNKIIEGMIVNFETVKSKDIATLIHNLKPSTSSGWYDIQPFITRKCSIIEPPTFIFN